LVGGHEHEQQSEGNRTFRPRNAPAKSRARAARFSGETSPQHGYDDKLAVELSTEKAAQSSFFRAMA